MTDLLILHESEASANQFDQNYEEFNKTPVSFSSCFDCRLCPMIYFPTFVTDARRTDQVCLLLCIWNLTFSRDNPTRVLTFFWQVLIFTFVLLSCQVVFLYIITLGKAIHTIVSFDFNLNVFGRIWYMQAMTTYWFYQLVSLPMVSN